ncbi:hypothetical protein KC340_g162 [Hortaea werneckii]|nr:hypothetical protein KC340_g162 [Hortaea werneckii]
MCRAAVAFAKVLIAKDSRLRVAAGRRDHESYDSSDRQLAASRYRESRWYRENAATQTLMIKTQMQEGARQLGGEEERKAHGRQPECVLSLCGAGGAVVDRKAAAPALGDRLSALPYPLHGSVLQPSTILIRKGLGHDKGRAIRTWNDPLLRRWTCHADEQATCCRQPIVPRIRLAITGNPQVTSLK